jgi:hypothetical protein
MLDKFRRFGLTTPEFKNKEHGPSFEVAKLKNERHTVGQIVVCVGQRAFFRGKTEKVQALAVVELRASVQFFDLLVFQDFDPVSEPVNHERFISPA